MRPKRTKEMNDRMIATRRKNRSAREAEKRQDIDTIAARMRDATEWLMRAERAMVKPHTEAELLAMIALRHLTHKRAG